MFLLCVLSRRSIKEQSVKPIKRLVASHVKAATLLSNVGAEVSFQLPNDASGAFKGMLSELDARKDELNINRYYLNSVPIIIAIF